MKDLKILCPFCNSTYDAEMLLDIEGSTMCETCGPDEGEPTVEVTCSNCKRVIYKKEGRA